MRPAATRTIPATSHGQGFEMLVASSCRGGAPTRRSRALAVLVGHEEQHEPRSRRCTGRPIPDGGPSCREDRETADQKDSGGAEHQDSERGDTTHGDPHQKPSRAPAMYRTTADRAQSGGSGAPISKGSPQVSVTPPCTAASITGDDDHGRRLIWRGQAPSAETLRAWSASVTGAGAWSGFPMGTGPRPELDSGDA